ncbi:MAG: T9SS type A sorting domain-containing protein, partial [Flavobacteriaceae bacterium]|nr:T9SS type A sorting domain-containing protein [Flavobacteriaceae bacterium]
LSAYSGNTGVQIRLLRSQDDRSMYIDDIEVVCVDCTPTHTVTGFSPDSGPENTYVTITGTGFTAGTAVTFNGASATIESQTATELVVSVPAGASTGVITVTEALCDVSTSTDFTLINSVDSSCEGGVSASELFISEITDATYGSMTYVEIYNGTGAAVNLSDYDLEITYNGNANNTDIVTLTGTLASGDVHVVRTSTAGFFCSVAGGDGSYADQIANGLNGIDSAKNDADCITLYKNSTAIDVWGDCSDKNWRENQGVAIGNEGFDFRRLASGSFPSTTFALADWSILDWTDGSSNSTCSTNDYSDIGSYASGFPPGITANPSPVADCDLTVTLDVTATEGFVGGNPLAYQWYFHAPGDANWTMVTNGADYSGATGSSLTINNVLNHVDYQYYCQVRENDGSCFQASIAIRLDVPRTTWDGANWDNGVPNINTIAVIDSDFVTSGGGNQSSFSACNLVINSGNRLTIDNLDFVEVENNVIVNGQFYIETHGALVQNDAAGQFISNVSDNDVVLTKTTHDLNNWYDYTYWSSPVNSALVSDALGFANPSYRFTFNAANYLDTDANDIDDNGDDWVLINGTDTMIPGVGYAATHNTIGFIPGVGYDYVFRGPFNTGTITSPVVFNAANLNHWNLIGNPYPSAISIDDFFADNSSQIDDVLYMWSHYRPPLASNPGNQVLNFNQSDYLVINATGETGNGSDLDGDGDVDGLDIPSRFVPSGQSFFVSSSANGNVTFNNAMRMADGSSNAQFFSPNPDGLGMTLFSDSSSEAEPNKLWLNMMSDNGAYNQLMVGYVPNATDGFDGISYDAKRQLSTGNAAIIYTMIQDKPELKFQIEGRHPVSLTIDEVIPIGFDTSIEMATIYTLSKIKSEGPFFNEHSVFLRDNYLDLLHDLNESDYQFTSDIGEFRDRFEIVFTNEALDLDDIDLTDSALIIYEDQFDHIHIKLPSHFKMLSVEVIDMLGRKVFSMSGLNTVNHGFDASHWSQATYLVRISTVDGQLLQKKIVKR